LRSIRLIARLDVKSPNLVKGIQLEGLRKIGDPHLFAKRYYDQGIDEIYYEDIVASLYDRNSIIDIIKKTTQDVFVPITVGGGLRSLEDIGAALRAGADKVSINTAAIKNPDLISQVAEKYGSQCMVLSIQAKNHGTYWEAYYDNGREHSELDAIDWAVKGQELGAGELLITSIDKEGMAKGFDVDLINQITSKVSIPTIASGGMGKLTDIEDIFSEGKPDAVAMAHVLHYDMLTVREIKEYCISKDIQVRPPNE
tara:strand:- start:44640 stop:45404 length:765 start_codon:yes stop_codon:yes gene_type:complete